MYRCIEEQDDADEPVGMWRLEGSGAGGPSPKPCYSKLKDNTYDQYTVQIIPFSYCFIVSKRQKGFTAQIQLFFVQNDFLKNSSGHTSEKRQKVCKTILQIFLGD